MGVAVSEGASPIRQGDRIGSRSTLGFTVGSLRTNVIGSSTAAVMSLLGKGVVGHGSRP